MSTEIVLTLTGHDRIGIVEAVTEVLVRHGGNILSSRMARLGGEFAMLVLVSLPGPDLSRLEADLQPWRAEGYQTGLLPTENRQAEKFAGWQAYAVSVEGADHEGIIHEVAQFMAQAGINIEEMETGVVSAPMSGTPLFTMQAVVLAPPQSSWAQWSAALDEIGHQQNVTITVTPKNK